MLAMISLPLAGCALNTETNSTLKQGIESDPSPEFSTHQYSAKIAVLAAYEDDREFAECIENGLRGALPNSTIISKESLGDGPTPWRALSNKPANETELRSLLNSPSVSSRLKEVDFIVYVEGATRWSESGKVGGGVPIVMGYVQKTRKTYITATIVDINRAELLGKSVVRARGIVAIPICMMFFPIPIGLATETSACHQMVKHIASSLAGESLRNGDLVQGRREVDTPWPLGAPAPIIYPAHQSTKKPFDIYTLSNEEKVKLYKRALEEWDAEAQYWIAEKSEGLICGRNVSSCVQEIRCAWSCALNATEYKDYRFEDLTEPARHVFVFRKAEASCWRVHSVDTDKCGKFIEEYPRWD
jgi:hypothetical protein